MYIQCMCVVQDDSRVSTVAADSGERGEGSGHTGLDGQRQRADDARLQAPKFSRGEVSRAPCLYAGPV